MSSSNTVMVFVPGTTGSRLIDPVSGTIAWPTQVTADAGNQAQQLADLENPNLQPYALASIYQSFFAFFENSANLANGQSFVTVPSIEALANEYAGQTLPTNLIVPFAYDWRQPNQVSANALGLALQAIDLAYNGNCDIWIVAHSMGGLVSRFLLESGMAKDTHWFTNLKGLITLGTPHLGAPLALSAITQELPALSSSLSDALIAAFIGDPSYPSSYQLLPPGNVSFVTDSSNNQYSIYNGAVYELLVQTPLPNAFDPQQGYAASAANLAAAQAFFSALSYAPAASGGGSTPPTPVPYYCIAGIDLDTATSFTYDPPANTLTSVSTTGDKIPPTPGGGDLIVPKWSALFNNAKVPQPGYPTQTLSGTAEFSGVDHMALPQNQSVQQMVAQWIQATSNASAPRKAEPAAA